MSISLDTSNSRLDKLDAEFLKRANIELYLKRDDLINEHISGNKWRKLKYNLKDAREAGFTKLLTFGGAFSNHIVATATAANTFGFESIGIIRGESSYAENPSLQFAQSQGMKLEFVSRKEYKEKTTDAFAQRLKERHGEFYLIPEGGTSQLALKGIGEIIDEIPFKFDVICTALGSGGTSAGLIKNSKGRYKVRAFSVLKGMSKTCGIETLIEENCLHAHTICHDYHFGGYAKYKLELIEFINDFKKEFHIPLDPIYTGKMMFGLFDQIKKDSIKPGSKIIALHTGGLQGIKGFNQRFGQLID